MEVVSSPPIAAVISLEAANGLRRTKLVGA